MILCHFFEKPVLAQHFLVVARENVVQAHARGNTRAYIFFMKLMLTIVFVSKTNFMTIGHELGKIYLFTKNKEKKYKKNAKCRKFPLMFSLEFSKKMSFFAVSAKTGFSKKWHEIMVSPDRNFW